MEVYNRLYDEIIKNELTPGTALTETEIAERLGVSRTPVREALRDLELDGLVISGSGRSSMVSDISPYDVEEIFDIRIALEILALEKSINRITDKEINDLLKSFENEKYDFNWEKNHKADKILHSLIIDRSGNKRLKNFLNNLNGQIERFRRIASKSEGRANLSIDEHIEFLLCLKTRDLKKSKESLKKHLISVKKSVMEICIIESMK